MTFLTNTDYEYARHLVFFGFLCGLTFAMLIATIVHIVSDPAKGTKDNE